MATGARQAFDLDPSLPTRRGDRSYSCAWRNGAAGLWYHAVVSGRFVHFIALLAAALVSSACQPSGDSGEAPPSYPGAEIVDISRIRFDDGDTFYLDGKPVRVLGIDTPETKSPDVGIFIDQPRGPEAAESTRVWMLRAKRLEIVRDGRGSYGRLLAHIFTDGELLAVRLLEARLAWENVSHFGDNGFPDLADQILDAAEVVGRPPFEQPYRWRKKNQKKSR